MPNARIYSRPDRAILYGLYELTLGDERDVFHRLATADGGGAAEFVQPSRRACAANAAFPIGVRDEDATRASGRC